MPLFSTTTNNDKVIASVIMMGIAMSLKSSFPYDVDRQLGLGHSLSAEKHIGK